MVGVALLAIFLAMGVDLGCGLAKATQRGEMKSSWGLKRTLNKFIQYEGGMLIAVGIDVLLQIGKIWHAFGIEVFIGIPLITCIIGIFLLLVEILSMRERADEKTKTEIRRGQDFVENYLTRKDIKEIIDAIKANKPKE